MNSEEIDEIFEAIKYEDEKYLWEICQMPYTYSQKNAEKYMDEYKRKLGEVIEQGDFEYFLTKKDGDESDKEIFALLLSYTSKIDEMKKYIDEREKIGLGSYEVMQLIIGTKDSNYIEYCLDNKIKELDLSDRQVLSLIMETKDSAYIKNCIENRREEFSLSHFDVVSLIMQIEDSEYKKECLENREKLELNSYDIRNIIRDIRDSNYIEDCIDNRKKELGLNSFAIMNLLKSIDDSDYIKNFIDNRREELGRNSRNLFELIKKVKDQDYIKNCIENRREELDLNSSQVFELIQEINDQDYVKNCIENKIEELNLHPIYVFELIQEIKDKDYIKNWIDNKREELNLSSKNTTDLLIRINDPEYVRNYIREGEKNGIRDEELKVLKIIYEKDYLNNILKNDTIDKINLPPEMTIGIEIESIGKNVDILQTFSTQLLGEWTCKEDGSLYSDNSIDDGIEIVSPILTGSNEKTKKEIVKTCSILREFGNYTNATCGGHIHIGADYLDNVHAWQNLLEIWTNAEQILYIIGNEKGNIPREEVTEFATPISRNLEEALDSGKINLESEGELINFKKEILRHQGYGTSSRYKGINFQNLRKNGKNTIEFRLPNGTINAKTWIQNINLFGGIVKTAQELSITQSKNEDELSDEEKKKLSCFENVRSDELDEKDKLEELIELVIEESQRDIYRERYEINNKLFEENSYIQEEIKKGISRKPLKISKNKIGKNVITGSSRVMGQEMEDASQKIEKDMEKENEKKINI